MSDNPLCNNFAGQCPAWPTNDRLSDLLYDSLMLSFGLHNPNNEEKGMNGDWLIPALCLMGSVVGIVFLVSMIRRDGTAGRSFSPHFPSKALISLS
jgi:hypothetical protein